MGRYGRYAPKFKRPLLSKGLKNSVYYYSQYPLYPYQYTPLNLMWYDPNEDSYTFIDLLQEENIKNKIIIDLGTSTGVLSEVLKGNLVIGVDLNRKALEEQQRLRPNPNLIRGDLLKSVKQEIVDIIIFNPPYVVDSLDPILGGGPLGRIVIDKFIKEIEVDLFYLLIIKANRPEEVVKGIEEKGYETKIMKIRKILGETIIIIKGKKK